MTKVLLYLSLLVSRVTVPPLSGADWQPGLDALGTATMYLP